MMRAAFVGSTNAFSKWERALRLHDVQLVRTSLGALPLPPLLLFDVGETEGPEGRATLEQARSSYRVACVDDSAPNASLKSAVESGMVEDVLWIDDPMLAIRPRLLQQASRAKRARDHAREENERHELLMQGTSDGVWDWDLKSNTVHCSPRWKVELGYEDHELTPTVAEFLDFIHEGDRRLFDAHMQEHLDGWGPFDVQYRLHHRAGHYIWVRARGYAKWDAEGRPARLAAFTTNTTEQQNAKHALLQAKEEAIAAAQAKASFLANMSHEIRTPMNGILGMASLLLATPLSSEARDHAETIHSSGEALLTILNDILDFSKIDAGKLEVERIVFPVRQALEDALSLVGVTAYAKGLDLVLTCATDVPDEINGDPGRLRQVITNLVGNAIKFTKEGTIDVLVSRVGDAPDGRILFEVIDTGIGISEEAQERLFQPFAQADSSTTRRFGGTGLGLAISKHLTELMGGNLTLKSAPGSGTRIGFTLPLEKSPHSEVTSPAPSGVRIVVAEPHHSTRIALAAALTRLGHEVDLCVAEADALVALGNPQVSLILVAESLSAALAEANATRSQPRPIVRIAARPNSQDDAGRFRATLIKPIRYTALRSKIDEWTGKSPQEPRALSVSSDMRAAQRPILVAEDNLVNQRVVTAMLKRWGFEVDVVANGQEAVDAVHRRSYGLVLMDCQMPELDGYEATIQIRRDPAFSDLPIIALTANALPEEAARCIDIGMTDHLAKPIRIDSLRAALDRYLTVLP